MYNIDIKKDKCKGSARHHLSKYKHWSKLIISVDTNKTNGFAFGGEFLDVNPEESTRMAKLNWL